MLGRGIAWLVDVGLLMRRRVTIADLAEMLGLDKSSVSLALRGSSKIGDATRMRVLEAARKEGYRPNLAARQLSSGTAQVVALVLPSAFAALANDVVVAAVQAMAQRAAEAGLMFGVISSDDLLKQAVNHTPSPLQPDGLLAWGDVPAEVTSAIAALGRPIIILDPNHVSYASYTGPAVRVDNAGGARAVVEHLLGRGARHLLFVQTRCDHLGHQQRWDGAREAWLAQRPANHLTRVFADDLADAALTQIAGQKASAIFCSNDFCAMQVWHRLQRLGIAVPGKILLAGFDGDRAGSLIGLTTAVFEGQTLGRRALELLEAHLAGNGTDSDQTLLPIRIRVGQTTGVD